MLQTSQTPKKVVNNITPTKIRQMPQILQEIIIDPTNPIETLRRCEGYYYCPKNKIGERTGPLVECPDTYKTPDGKEKHYVSDIYHNLAKAEQYPYVYTDYANKIVEKLALGKNNIIDMPTVALGMPMDGINFAHSLALAIKPQCKNIFCEKKITRMATVENSEEFIFVLNYHEIYINDKIVIVKNVYDDFHVIDKVVELVERLSA